MQVRFKIWFENDDGEVILGPGTYDLLKLIDVQRSISRAAELMGMSYRHAWGLLKELEEHYQKPFIISTRGGKSGGYTELTEFARKFVSRYEQYLRVMNFYIEQPWIRPAIAVDGVLIRDNKILLIKRKNPPFEGRWALPGWFVDYGESTESAVLREFKEETNLDVHIKSLVGVYSQPDRDPRWHTISTVYLLESQGSEASLKAMDDAADASFFSVDALPPLAFDHEQIVNDSLSLLSRL